MSTSAERQNVVIVGGGHAGLAVYNDLATQLDEATSNLILVTPRPYFHHLPASVRLVVSPEGNLEDSILRPFGDKYNSVNRKLILAKVASIVDSDEKGRYLVLDNGEHLDFSILVLAPGTKWEGPLDFPDTKDGVVEWANTWRSRFQNAKDIVIVGGGSLGVELAGEIKDIDLAKTVTIVHGQSLLMNDTYPSGWRKTVTEQFRNRGVDLVLGDYLDDLSIKEGYITTRKNQAIKADLVVPARGGQPNTKFIRSFDSSALMNTGHVKVLSTLQLPSHPHIFAAGDIIDWKEEKQAAKVLNHAAVIKNNILVLLGLRKTMTNYKGSYEMVILTNGKNGGSGYFGVLWGITIGNWLTSLLKSRDLMVDRVMKSLGFE